MDISEDLLSHVGACATEFMSEPARQALVKAQMSQDTEYQIAAIAQACAMAAGETEIGFLHYGQARRYSGIEDVQTQAKKGNAHAVKILPHLKNLFHAPPTDARMRELMGMTHLGTKALARLDAEKKWRPV